MYNHADRLTITTCASATKIPKPELDRTLRSLALHKHVKLLLKEGAGRESVGDDEGFCFNEQFTHAKYRIVVNQIQAKETPEETEATRERVFEDRQYQVDAAVVRVMKSRRRLGHTELCAEVFRLCAFPFQASELKKRIESLIERDYLERDPADLGTYVYMP